MKTMTRATATLLILLSAIQAWGTITIGLEAERLKDWDGSDMPLSGLVILVASTTDAVFNGPSPTAFVSGDDLLLGKYDLNNGWKTPGILTLDLHFTPSGEWSVTDPLKMFWFPTLTTEASAPGSGTRYGEYRHPTGLDGSGPWATPSDMDTVDLKFFTSDATFLYGPTPPGSNPADSGRALQVVPEPMAYGVLMAALCVGFAVLRRCARRRS